TSAFLEAGLAERAASGELFHPNEDLVFIGAFGIERTAVPAFEFAMLLVLGIDDGVEEQFEAGDAANIFWRSAAVAGYVAGILGSRVGVGDRLDRDRVPPVVAEVVGVGEFRDATIDQRAEPHGLGRVGSVAQTIPFGIEDG